MDYLNEIEKEQVRDFLKNKTLVNAVKKIVLRTVYMQGILQQGEDPHATENYLLAQIASLQNEKNETIGASLRAIWEAVKLLEDGFRKLDELSTPFFVKPKVNLNPR